MALTCPGCNKPFANPGLLNNHRKRFCRAPDPAPEPPQEKPEVAQPRPQPTRDEGPIDTKLKAVCEAIECEGLDIETACAAVRAPVRFYHEAMRKLAIGDDTITDDEREAATRVQQADAEFERDLMRRINNNKSREDLAAATTLLRQRDERMKRRPLQFEYNAMVLLDVVKKHVDLPTYKAILGDLCEIDPLMSTLALDPKLIHRG